MGLMDNMATMGIHYVKAIAPGQAAGKVAEVYEQINKDFMNAAPFTLHSSQPDMLAGTWSLERETMFHGRVPRAVKEAIAAGVSTINECPYCVDAHTMMLHATDEHAAAQAIYNKTGHIENEKIEKIVAWAKATRTPDSDLIQNPPFTLQEAPEIFGAALAFHYINRMANIFLEENVMPSMGPLTGIMRRTMAGTMMKGLLNRKIEAGASLQFLPQADLPDDLAWAQSNAVIAKTFAGMAAATEAAIRDTVSDKVIAAVLERIAAWHGEDTGMSRAWLNEVTEGLDEKEATAARLALLAAIASYQVSESDIENFGQYYPDDAALIAVTGWGAYRGIRRISSWLKVPQSAGESATVR